MARSPPRCASLGGQADHLHDQRHRVREYEFAQDHEEPWLVSQRRGVAEIVLFGAEQHCQEVDDAGAKLEARAEPVYHSIWGKDADELTLAPFTQNSGHPLNKGPLKCTLPS